MPHPDELEEPEVAWTLRARLDAPRALLEGSAATALLQDGEPVAASADAAVLAVGLPGGWPGRVARWQAGAVEAVEGLLVAPGLPYIFNTVGDRLHATPLAGGPEITGAAKVGLGESDACCGWWEHSLWSGGGAGLLRAVSPPKAGWSLVERLRPGAEAPAWRLELRDEPSRVAAAALSPDGRVALLASSDADGQASLIALDAQDGRELWRTQPPGAVRGWRARRGRLASDDARGVLLLDGPDAPLLWVFSLQDGAELGRVALGDFAPPPEPALGLLGDEVWLFQRLPAASSDLAERGASCTYATWSLRSGERTRLNDQRLGQTVSEGLSPRWQGAFERCELRSLQPMGEELGIWTQPEAMSLELYTGPLP